MTVRLAAFVAYFPIYALAVARITRFITTDVLFKRLRDRLQWWLATNRHPQLLYLTGCSWCASVWVAPVVLVTAYYVGRNPAVLIVAASLAASYVTGWLASRDGAADARDDDEPAGS